MGDYMVGCIAQTFASGDAPDGADGSPTDEALDGADAGNTGFAVCGDTVGGENVGSVIDLGAVASGDVETTVDSEGSTAGDAVGGGAIGGEAVGGDAEGGEVVIGVAATGDATGGDTVSGQVFGGGAGEATAGAAATGDAEGGAGGDAEGGEGIGGGGGNAGDGGIGGDAISGETSGGDGGNAYSMALAVTDVDDVPEFTLAGCATDAGFDCEVDEDVECVGPDCIYPVDLLGSSAGGGDSNGGGVLFGVGGSGSDVYEVAAVKSLPATGAGAGTGAPVEEMAMVGGLLAMAGAAFATMRRKFR